MALTATLSLGEVKPKYKARYLSLPSLKVDFDVAIDTGFDATDHELRAQVEKNGPKILAGHIKERVAQIEKAIAAVDGDIDKKITKFFKDNGIDPKARVTTPEKKKKYDLFVAQMEGLVERLQTYLQQIVDGINTSDSMKWVNEVIEVCYEKMKSMLKTYEIKRASGGRAKIVILALIAIAVVAIGVAATVATGGALAAVIAAGIGAALIVVATVGKTVTALIKTKDKLLQSVGKLKKDVEAVEALIKECEACEKKYKTSAEQIRDPFLSKVIKEKDLAKLGGDKKLSKETIYRVMSGKYKDVASFERHFTDAQAYAAKMHMELPKLYAEIGRIEECIRKATNEVADRAKAGQLSDKALKAYVAWKKEMDMRQSQLVGDTEKLLAGMEALDKVLAKCRPVAEKLDDLGIASANIPGSRVSLGQVENFFTLLDGLGKNVKDAGTSMQKVSQDWKAIT